MRVINVLPVLSIILVIALPLSQAQTPPIATNGVLVMRYGWAPLFCYAGSASGVPDEYCGYTPPARTRFAAHRALRLLYSNSTGAAGEDCPDPTSGYTPAALTPPLRAALTCIDNSYSLGNDDGWHNYIWNASGTCAATAAGLNVTQYFQIMADTFSKYNVDTVLKQAGLNFDVPGTVGGVQLLDTLQAAFGQRGFYTCDPGTKTKYSTFSICLTLTAPYNITKCPDSYLKPAKCPDSLLVVTENSGPVTSDCYPYYPAFAPPPPPPSPPPPPAVKTCSFQGAYRFESVSCPGKYLAYDIANLNATLCANSAITLRTISQAKAPRTHWALNATSTTGIATNTSSIVAAARLAACQKARAASATVGPQLVDSSWSAAITPVNAFTSCDLVTLKGGKGATAGKLLGVGSDCSSNLNFQWGADSTAVAMQWKLKKV